MLAAEKPPLGEAYLAHISFKPWSAYTKADYTPEQWHKACLIHQHQGPPTSKDQCKLPVRTPLGALNKNGVQAAKAALNGARGGVDATPEEKAKAKSQLETLAKELDSKVPAFLAKHSDMDDEEMLAHFGRKGMKWGVRTDRSSGSSSGGDSSSKPKMSTGKKVAIAATAAAGAAAVALLLTRSGRKSVSTVTQRMVADREGARSMQKAQARTKASFISRLGRGTNPNSPGFGVFGKATPSPRTMKTPVADISRADWKSRVSAVLKDIKGANAEQDAYMRSIGLGAAVNRGG